MLVKKVIDIIDIDIFVVVMFIVISINAVVFGGLQVVDVLRRTIENCGTCMKMLSW